MTLFRQCVRCGNCCRWRGYVRLKDGEAEAIAAHLGLAVEVFLDRFTRLTDDRRGLSLIEKSDGSCIFLEGENDCRVQPAKPAQCAGFPNEWSFPGFERQCRSKVMPHE
jgi:Fe-S-cluster containining protein